MGDNAGKDRTRMLAASRTVAGIWRCSLINQLTAALERSGHCERWACHAPGGVREYSEIINRKKGSSSRGEAQRGPGL